MSVEKISASLNLAVHRHLNWNVHRTLSDQDRVDEAYERIIEKYAKWCQRANVSPYDLSINGCGDGRDVIGGFIADYMTDELGVDPA